MVFFFPSIIGKRLKHCPELGGKTHMEEECFWTHASPYSKCFPSHVIQSPEFSTTQKTLSELMFFCKSTLHRGGHCACPITKTPGIGIIFKLKKTVSSYLQILSHRKKTGRYFLFSLNTTLWVSTEDEVRKGK